MNYVKKKKVRFTVSKSKKEKRGFSSVKPAVIKLKPNLIIVTVALGRAIGIDIPPQYFEHFQVKSARARSVTSCAYSMVSDHFTYDGQRPLNVRTRSQTWRELNII